MEQVKIFSHDRADFVEYDLNKWLRKNRRTIIVAQRMQSNSDRFTVISIWYTLKKKKKKK